MRDLLIKWGWYYSRNCNCGGYYQEVFKHKDRNEEIRIFPNSGKWRMDKAGRTIIKGMEESLVNVLNQ